MKNAIKLVALSMVFSICSSLYASSTVSTAQNATEAVFQAQGYVDAKVEAESVLISLGASYNGLSHIGFRNMARNSASLMYLMILTGQSPVAVAYFRGRMEGFNTVADLLGEP